MRVVTNERETCACGHDKDTHHSEIESSGDVTQTRTRRYTACLGSFCDCKSYRKDQS